MRLQHRFAQTGEAWDEYRAARPQLATRFGGTPAPSVPGTQDNPLWRTLRAFYCYDPGPILRRLQTPTLAIFGELDYTLRVLPRANHVQWEAKIGSNGEMASLNGFVPEYFTTVEGWLAKRIQGFGAARLRHDT